MELCIIHTLSKALIRIIIKGHCEDLNVSLAQHNSGMTTSLRPYIPFHLVYSETFNTRDEAISREKYFKSAAGRRYLKAKLAS